MSGSEFYSSFEKVFKRLVDHHHVPVGEATDAVVSASRSRGTSIPVGGTDGRIAVRCRDDTHWNIRIGSARSGS